jgi:hypothetical protein
MALIADILAVPHTCQCPAKLSYNAVVPFPRFEVDRTPGADASLPEGANLLQDSEPLFGCDRDSWISEPLVCLLNSLVRLPLRILFARK